MKVYIVYRMWVDYNGSDVDMKVFAKEEDAQAYMETRKTNNGYYWDRLRVAEVE
jgi:hypothetical protein